MDNGVMCADAAKLCFYIVGPNTWIKSEKIRQPTKKKKKPHEKELFLTKNKRGFFVSFRIVTSGG